MEEIEQLLAKLKRDQNALHAEFKDKITLIYTGNQKKFKDDTFRELEDIISSVFSLTYMFKKSREQHYVRARSVFDYILIRNLGFSCNEVGAETSRHRTTIMNSLFIFDSYMREREFKNNYEKVMTLFEEYKSRN